MDKREIALYLESAETVWHFGAESVDKDLVLIGFEEHVLIDESKKVFKTEQVLDKRDLQLIKSFIDNVLERMP